MVEFIDKKKIVAIQWILFSLVSLIVIVGIVVNIKHLNLDLSFDNPYENNYNLEILSIGHRTLSYFDLREISSYGCAFIIIININLLLKLKGVKYKHLRLLIASNTVFLLLYVCTATFLVLQLSSFLIINFVYYGGLLGMLSFAILMIINFALLLFNTLSLNNDN